MEKSGCQRRPCMNAQTRTVWTAPGRARSLATAHVHTSSAQSALPRLEGQRSGRERHARPARATGDLQEHLLRIWPLLAPGLHFCSKANVSARVFSQLSASKARNIALLSSMCRGSQFLLSLQKMKPEQVVQSNSNRLSRLQPNGHN